MRKLIAVLSALVVLPAGLSSGSAALAQSSSTTTPPLVAAVSPDRGPSSGGTEVTISGSGFTGAIDVAFGGTRAASYSVPSGTRIQAVAPPGTGVRDVVVVTPGGISRPGAADFYAYGSARPPADTSLASASQVATPTAVTLQISPQAPKSSFAAILGRWCPLAMAGGVPMAPLVCGVKAFSPATATWDQASRTATVYAGADRLSVSVGATSARLMTPGGSRTIALDPPAMDPAGSVLVPLPALARAVGGRAGWDAATRTATVQATADDPGMAQAQALLAAVAAYPGRNAATDAFGGPAGGVPATGYLRDVFVEGGRDAAVCRTAPPAGFVREGTGSGRGPGYSTNSTTYVLSAPGRLGSGVAELEVGEEYRPHQPASVRCDALVTDAPTRPAPDPVPAGAASVKVTRESFGEPLGTPTSITDLATVRRLISIADRLPVFAGPQVVNCPAGTAGKPTGVRFDFRYGGSDPRTVTLDEGTWCISGTVSVQRPGRTYPELWDPALSLAQAAGVAVR